MAGERAAVRSSGRAVAARRTYRVLGVDVHGQAAGLQGASRGRADGGAVVPIEENTIRHQRVYARGVDLCRSLREERVVRRRRGVGGTAEAHVVEPYNFFGGLEC